MDATGLGSAKGDGRTDMWMRLAIKEKEGLKKTPVGINNVPTVPFVYHHKFPQSAPPRSVRGPAKQCLI